MFIGRRAGNIVSIDCDSEEEEKLEKYSHETTALRQSAIYKIQSSRLEQLTESMAENIELIDLLKKNLKMKHQQR